MDRFDVFVIGAGAIGVEFAQICPRFGNQVTLVEAARSATSWGSRAGHRRVEVYVVREHGRNRIIIATADRSKVRAAAHERDACCM